MWRFLSFCAALLALSAPAAAQDAPASWDGERALLFAAGVQQPISLTAEELGDALTQGRYAGLTVRLAVPAEERGSLALLVAALRPAWEALSGATLELLELPEDQLEPGTLLALEPRPDGVIAPAWSLGAYAEHAVPLSGYQDDPDFPAVDLGGQPPAARPLSYWQEAQLGVPLSPSALLLYWREDILADPVWQERFLTEEGAPLPYPPSTWADVLAVARYFQGRNWSAEDSDPDYGLVSPLGDDLLAGMLFAALAAPARVARDACKPLFWFDPGDFASQINTTGHLLALEFWQRLFEQGPQQQLTYDLAASQTVFLRGKAVMTLAGPELARIAQDETRSRVKGALGVSALPGHLAVQDQCTGASLTLPAPNALGNAFGPSWQGLVLREGAEGEALYSFYALLASAPVRRWMMLGPQFQASPASPADAPDPTVLLAAGWHPDDLARFLAATAANAARPLHAPYLRVDGTPQFMQALAAQMRAALLGRVQAQEALDLTAEAWQAIIAERGRDALLKQYREGPGAP
jgi:multiple sugar transport system substrate-binding protein